MSRVALVTGANSGIGKSAAIRLEEDNYTVYAFDKVGDGSQPFTIVGDVCSEADWRRVVAKIEQEQGRLDVLVNSAGILHEEALIETSVASFREVLEVNVIGTFLGCREMLPLLEKSKHAAIVNVGSINGLRGSFNHSAYGASKGAVTAFTRAIALELAEKNIRVNAICPGTVETPMVSSMFDAGTLPSDRTSLHPLGGRISTPREQANAIAFLAGEQASFITGIELSVDGGRAIR